MNTIENKSRIIPKMTNGAAVILASVCSLLAGFSAAGFGGVFALCFSGVLFGLLCLCAPYFIAAATLPASYITALIFTLDPVVSLTALSFLIIGIPFAVCIYKNKSLSVSTALVTVTLLASFAVVVSVNIIREYGSIGEGITEIKSSVSDILDKLFSMYKYPLPDGSEFSVSEEDIAAIKSTMKMMSPSVAVMTAEAISYACLKLYRLILRVVRCEEGLNGQREWSLTLSAPAAFLLLLSFAAGLLLSVEKNPVVYYAAVNITYIFILPALAIGVRIFFARNGIIRRAQPVGKRITLIVFLVVAASLSPVLLLLILAMTGVFSSFGKKHGNGEEPEGK